MMIELGMVSGIRELLHQFGKLFLWFFVVAPWEQALRVRAGKYVRLLRAGIHLRLPFVDRVYLQSVRRRITMIPSQTLTTKCRKAITISGALGYEIVNLQKLYDTLHDAEDTICHEVMGLIAGFVIARRIEDCSAADLQAHVKSSLHLDQYGLGKQEFFLTCFAHFLAA